MPISYNQSDFTYNQAGATYNQVAIARTATGSGTGAQTATKLLQAKRDATGSGVGTAVAETKVTQLRLGALTDFSFPYRFGGRFYLGPAVTTRTATGSGIGTQTATASVIRARTATGSGTGSQSAAAIEILPRTATGSGVGSTNGGATGLITRFRTATGSGAGTQTATRIITRLQTATGSGAGTQTATGLHVVPRTATGSGAGTQTATALKTSIRTATGSGVGTINVSRTNLVTNPNIEVNTTGWVARNGSTQVRTTTQAVSGVASITLTTSASVNNGTTVFPNVPVTAGTAYSFSGYAKADTGTLTNCFASIIWFNSSSIEISRITGTFTTLTTSWARLSASGVAPAGTVTAQCFIVRNTAAVGFVWYVDAFLLETGSTVLPYFDGAGIAPYPGYTLTSVGWNGTANASTSTANFIGITQFKTAIRTANASAGTGSSTTIRVITRLRTATASGQGTATSTAKRLVIRTSTGSGTGTSSGFAFTVKFRTATGSAIGTSTTIGFRSKAAYATGSGTGSSNPALWLKSFIFRPPFDKEFRWAKENAKDTNNLFFGKMTRGQRASNIYKLIDGTYTTIDGRDDSRVVKVYHGGHEHTVTAEEKADLTAAGYGAYIT